MRFKAFLRENPEINLEQALKRIAHDCQFYLNQNLSAPLLRGISVDSPILMDSPQPKNRRAMSSSATTVFWFNAMAENAIGVKNIRQTSVFCTSSPFESGVYGTVFLIFPKGNFKYVWSDTIFDSFIEAPEIFGQIEKGADKIGYDQERLRYDISDRYDGHSLNAASDWLKTIKPGKATFRDVLTNAWKDLRYHDSEMLDDAVIKQHEILIYESEGYHSISLNMICNKMAEEYYNSSGSAKSITPKEALDYLVEKMGALI